MYDVTRSRSFGNIHEWYSDIKKVSNLAQEVLIEALVTIKL